MKTKLEIISDYALGKETVKWISPGADILRCIGSEMILVRFKKTDVENQEPKWEAHTGHCFVLSIGDYEPMTGTYEIKYRDEESKEITTERIIPEGFSFNNPDKDGWMRRFIPVSLHYRLVEEELFYNRLAEMWQSEKGLGLDRLREFENSKQEDTLGYANWIAAVINSDVPGGLGKGIIQFRIYGMTKMQLLSKAWTFGIKDKEGNNFQIKFPQTDETGEGIVKGFSVDGQLIGDLKFLDIQSPKENEAENTTPENP